jgi:hypothetical protein
MRAKSAKVSRALTVSSGQPFLLRTIPENEPGRRPVYTRKLRLHDRCAVMQIVVVCWASWPQEHRGASNETTTRNRRSLAGDGRAGHWPAVHCKP